MKPPRNPHAKDAEAASQWVKDLLDGKKRWARDAYDLDFVTWLATWAGHWGRRALKDTKP